MLSPGRGRTHRAYLWSHCTTACDPIAAVVLDFADCRGGCVARALTFERRMFHALFGTADQKEGMAAFLEKREPRFYNV
jgi:1,4-dihydroxy-2-naphthoyl-CoA synthase